MRCKNQSTILLGQVFAERIQVFSQKQWIRNFEKKRLCTGARLFYNIAGEGGGGLTSFLPMNDILTHSI